MLHLKLTFIVALLRAGTIASISENGEIPKTRLVNESSVDIAFDLPDLTTIVDTTSGRFQLEAFKWTKNDQILRNARSSSADLRWVSIGHASFVKTADPTNSSITKLFQESIFGFSTYIQMLTPAHCSVLAEAAKAKYHMDVSANQILNLILSKFECSLKMLNEFGSEYLLKGEVSDFHQFPLQMDFEAPPGSVERKLFRLILMKQRLLKFKCRLFALGKEAKTNTLTITLQQQQVVGLKEKLFGRGSGNTSNISSEVFVTRNQLEGLANELYTTLNILEEYEMPEVQFCNAFVSDLISRISDRGFTHVPINKALHSLSEYGLEDFEPDAIERHLGSLFRIETLGNESRIIHTSENLSKLLNSSSHAGRGTVVGFGYLLFTVGELLGSANANTVGGTPSSGSLSDQLNNLNAVTQNEVTWGIDGDRVVPKSLNVARLTRSKLGRTLLFSRVRLQSTTVLFDRHFSMYSYRSLASTPILQDMQTEIIDLRRQINNLSTTVTANEFRRQAERQADMQSRFMTSVDNQSPNILSNVSTNNTSFDNQFQDILANVSDHQTSIDNQFQNILANVSNRIDDNFNQITRLFDTVKILQTKPSISRCQLCFQVYTSTNCYYYNNADSKKVDEYCTGTTSNYDNYGSWSAPYSPGNGHYYVCWMKFKLSCS